MKPTLGRRLAALEAVNRAANNFALIVIRFIDPGVQAGEATFATALGQRFTREPSETEDDFIDRIHDCAKANCPPGQSAVQAHIDHDGFEK
jgi:hypothetical protein